MNRVAQIIVGVVLMLAVAGGSFYAGMVYGQGQGGTDTAQADQISAFATARANGEAPAAGQFGGRGQRDATGAAQAGGNTFGEIESIADGVITITTNAGATVQVQVADTTLIEKNASVTVNELEVGETVIVSGSENADGSITARSVQVSPAGRFGGAAPTQ
ncbi:MAG: hypothetical protein KBG20_18055 [Caldilineaceae bacterium]|nr:hypothetical protein [Caldilineaceae bacterium]MBP8108193.1 hypothetical protein [Caldilineaceae bacterium]MBP8124243.1 hypothetical protein [Caldilineaceae bacterium]MBP9074215.1 hypothetical protein [Caldilineaceae bacterium]